MTMKPEHLTAWALNELSDAERAQIEAALKATPDTAAQAQELKNFCQFLGEHLVDDDAALDAEQRAALEHLAIASPDNVVAFDSTVAPVKMNGSVAPTEKLIRNQSRRWPRVLIGVAACGVVAAIVAGLVMPSFNNVRREPMMVAQQDVRALPAEAPSETVRVQPKLQEVAKVTTPPSPPAAPAPISPVIDQSKVGKVLGAQPQIFDMGGALPSASPAPDKLVVQNTPPKLARKAEASEQPLIAGSGVVTSTTTSGATVNTGSIVLPAVRTRRAPASYPSPQIRPTTTALGDVNANTERYASISENKFLDPSHDPLSTFSIDVDSASYANVRRFLNAGQRPPADAVRLEELVNYFPYAYEPPAKDSAQPFSVSVDLAEAPWEPTHRLARIGIKGRQIGQERKQANFVFLVDVSGSMNTPDKLPLVKQSLEMLMRHLKDDDRVAIITYAGESGVLLPSTEGKQRKVIEGAVNSMQSGGSTNGASGITLAYEEAQKHFIEEGINRVILCTDGDFNVGVSSPDALEKLIKEKAKSGVFLSVLGYGAGNLKDEQMETLADKGNGNYAYIDSLSEARKVLVEQMSGTLITIAKDVKIQVEFNPAQVRSYRLLGYENRVLVKEDFNNDRKDAGEIGAGHTVTALYEIVPVDAPLASTGPLVDELKYQPKPSNTLPNLTGAAAPQKLTGIGDEVMTVKLRYKEPDGQLSKLIQVPVKDAKRTLEDAPKDFQFAAAVAGFGMLLRDSENKGDLSWEDVRELAITGKGEDNLGYRGEFIQLIDKANGASAGQRGESLFKRLSKSRTAK